MKKVYRFDLTSKLSQIIGVAAESREEAHKILMEILQHGGSPRCSMTLNDIKKELRDKGFISQVNAAMESSSNHCEYQIGEYKQANRHWALKNPEKREGGVWDEEISIDVKPEQKYDAQVWFKYPRSADVEGYDGNKMYLETDGIVYGEHRDLTEKGFNEFKKFLTDNFDIEETVFDISKLKKGPANANRLWKAYIATKKNPANPNPQETVGATRTRVVNGVILTPEEFRGMLANFHYGD